MIKTTCKPDPEQWHRYYAWWPIYFYKIVGDRICRTKVWLEYVERKGVHHYGWGDSWWSWEYRMLGGPSDKAK